MESHAELDQEQVFINCINSSYYLMPPEGGERREEEREVAGEGMKKENERMGGEGRKNGVIEEEWQDGEGEQLEVAASEDREQEKEEDQANSQGESAEKVQVMEEETRNERELENEGVLQVISMETSNRQVEATTRLKSQDNTTDTCTPAAEVNTQAFLSPESIHADVLEGRTHENTLSADGNPRAAKDTHTSTSSGNTNLCFLGVDTHLSSAALEQDVQASHSEEVNYLQA